MEEEDNQDMKASWLCKSRGCCVYLLAPAERKAEAMQHFGALPSSAGIEGYGHGCVAS